MCLTQTQKESLISVIENYTSYDIFFFEGEDVSSLADRQRILQIFTIADYFYAIIHKGEIAFLYKDSLYKNPPSFFKPDKERDDILFEVFWFCIENDLAFSSNRMFFRIYSSKHGSIYMDLKEKPLKETLKFLKKMV